MKSVQNKTLAVSGTMLALSIMLVGGISFVSAHNEEGFDKGKFGHEKMGDKENHLERKAELLEIPVEELKTRLDSGESWKDIAESLGLSKEDMRAKIKQRAIEHINQLLADGEITQETADKKIEWIESGEKKFRGYHRFHKGDVK